jgi:hypothetical protein
MSASSSPSAIPSGWLRCEVLCSSIGAPWPDPVAMARFAKRATLASSNAGAVTAPTGCHSWLQQPSPVGRAKGVTYEPRVEIGGHAVPVRLAGLGDGQPDQSE